MDRKQTEKEYKYRVSFTHPDIMEDLSTDVTVEGGERISLASLFVDMRDLTFRYDFKEYRLGDARINKVVEIETVTNKYLLYK